MKSSLLITTVLLVATIGSTLAAPGDLDVTFDTDGKVNTPIGNGDDIARAVAIQADGKIVVAGYSRGTNYDFAIVRYKIDGSLDNSFDIDGKVTTSVGTGSSFALAVAIQPDGKIVEAGSSSNGVNEDFALVRYNSDGSLDTSFGANGKVTTPIGSGADNAFAVAIQSDGKIVAAGSTFGPTYDFALVRYNSDGSLDTTFDADGKVTTPIGSGDDTAYSIAIQPDGKIIAAGFSFNGTNNDFAVVRYNVNGSLDSSFDLDGKVTTSFGTGEDVAHGLAIQSDGKIIVAGNSRPTDFIPSNFDFAIVRYNTDGSLDTSFDTDGKVTTPIGSGDDAAYSVGIQFNGKIIAAGGRFASGGTTNDFALARYNMNGSLDTSFGNSGKVITPFGFNGDLAYAVAIQADGKVVAVGLVQIITTIDHDFAVARYLGDETPATNVSVAGRVLSPDGRGLRNAGVSITDQNNVSRRVTTSSFGFYSFDNVQTGQSYTISVASRLYRFMPRNVLVFGELTNIDFIGLE